MHKRLRAHISLQDRKKPPEVKAIKNIPENAKKTKDLDLTKIVHLTVQEFAEKKKTTRRTIYNNLDKLDIMTDGKLVKIIWAGRSKRWTPQRYKYRPGIKAAEKETDAENISDKSRKKK